MVEVQRAVGGTYYSLRALPFTKVRHTWVTRAACSPRSGAAHSGHSGGPSAPRSGAAHTWVTRAARVLPSVGCGALGSLRRPECPPLGRGAHLGHSGGPSAPLFRARRTWVT